jgi:hypothetical protein
MNCQKDTEQEGHFKPSVKACSQRGCKDLIEIITQFGKRRVCKHNGRIPGNIYTCPKDEDMGDE